MVVKTVINFTILVDVIGLYKPKFGNFILQQIKTIHISFTCI